MKLKATHVARCQSHLRRIVADGSIRRFNEWIDQSDVYAESAVNYMERTDQRISS